MNRRMSRESLTGTILRDSTAGRTAGACSSEPKPGSAETQRDYNPQLLPMSEVTTSTSSKFFSCNIVFIFIQPEFRNSNERRSKPGVAKTPKRSASKSILVFGILFHWLDAVTQRSADCRRPRGRMYCLRYGRFAPGSYFIFHCGIRVQVNLVNDKPK